MGIAFKLIRSLMDGVGALPLGFHYGCGRALSWVAHHVFRYRESVVRTNVARSFPDMTYSEVDQTVDKFYRHFGDIIAETIWFGGCKSYKRLNKQGIARVEGFEGVEKAYEDGKSVMVLFSHCGNWELIGGLFGYLGRESSWNLGNAKVVYKKLSSKTWDDVMSANRIAPCGECDCMLESARVLRYAVSHKNDQVAYVFPTDQAPYKVAKAHRVKNFLNQKTVTMTGGAALAKMLGMSVFVLGMPSEGRGHYIFRFEKICDDASEYSPEEIMDRYYEILEKDIKAQPWNYLWTHKRWKHRDQDEALLAKEI